jgi:hypothetical protein
MAILLTRMKIFNSFVRKHFTQKPQLIASSLFLTCLFIDSPVAFALKISSYHYYTDNKQENVNTFYIMTASDFSSTPYGVNSSWHSLHFSSIYCSHSSWASYWILSRCVSTNCIWERLKTQRDEAYKRASNTGKSEQVLKRQEMTVKRGQRKKSRKVFAFYVFDFYRPFRFFRAFYSMFSYVFSILCCLILTNVYHCMHSRFHLPSSSVGVHFFVLLV